MANTKYVTRCIIAIAASLQETANNYFKNNIDEHGGENTFTRGISETGDPPAQGYIADTSLTPRQVQRLATVVAGRGPNEVQLGVYPVLGLTDRDEIMEWIEGNGANIRVLSNSITVADILPRLGPNGMQFVETEEP